MKLKVELQAYLDQYAPAGQAAFDYDLADGSTVQSLIAKLGMPYEVAAVVIVGDKVASMDQQLNDSDHVTVIPPLAGG